ncbi:thioesterase family protein [Glaciecola sp. XM2]|jgi:acyl-CoA thioesterase II|uniref:acyl-CoA thioesterase n=1 Tax=Glaciecola sp. XM2 TaxID=1914931 RepID=UPI001BDEFD91|nr:thioesterase family protein [Glaciecola sp. XM2]MBT1449734.1 thioesterase family protein [Glaciecola sp. XM2]
MDIDALLSLAATHRDYNDIEVTIPKEWSQGRTVYGGLSAAMLYASTKHYVEPDRLLRSMTTNFVGPLMSQTPFSITVEMVREGKNVSQLQARAVQDGKNAVVVQMCFAKARVSKSGVVNNEQHMLDAPKKGNFIPQVPKITPKFLKHFQLEVQSGGLPFTGKKDAKYYGWMRFKKPPAEITDAHIVSLIDAWPPTLLQQLRWPAPASTVSWNLEFIHPHRELLPTDWFAYKADTRQAADGYGHTEATIWDAHGEVIALSRQTVAVFD